MKIKTSELTGPALDWAVCIAKGINPDHIYISKGSGPKYTNLYRRNVDEDGNLTDTYTTGPDLLFSRKWESAGPIIERERLDINYDPGEKMWTAHWFGDAEYNVSWGDTPLIAAMRCFVASKLGDEVDIPEELLTKSDILRALHPDATELKITPAEPSDFTGFPTLKP